MVATVDLDALLALREQRLELSSVPAARRAFAIKGIASQNAFAENETMALAELSSELVGACRDAVGAVGLRLGAVDLIADDPTLGPKEGGGVVLEVNGTPGLHYHYRVAEPERAARVAVPILDRLLAEE